VFWYASFFFFFIAFILWSSFLPSIAYVNLWSWLFLDAYKITFGFLFDSLTAVMVLLITVISFFVHLYSVGYMENDPHISRFMGYLSLFTFFMLVLVSSSNFFQLFIGWEGVGLCSYLLINFWYNRILANKAALKAMIINRIADVFFILGILLIFLFFRNTEFLIVFDLVGFLNFEYFIFFFFSFRILDLITFFLLLGAFGKSAQIIFHTWLPDAMEGPTPVSALLHAATMVTAGVFLLARCSPFFEYSSNSLFLATFFGGFTAFFFSIVSVFQFDIKKIIAYSTCSQLGYMFFSCGFSNYQAAIFHLFNHGFFKALLFLGAGSIIHALADEQDMRKMGALVNIMPFTYICMFIGSLSIVGFPFFTGFYSKDFIFESTFSRFISDGLFIYCLGLCAAFFTAMYSIKLLFFVFFCRPKMSRVVFESVHEANIFMSLPLFFLSLMSIFIGYIFSDAFIGFGTFFWGILFLFYLYIFIVWMFYIYHLL
jgi:NADH-quinone oxidoreductase subunit L